MISEYLTTIQKFVVTVKNLLITVMTNENYYEIHASLVMT